MNVVVIYPNKAFYSLVLFHSGRPGEKQWQRQTLFYEWWTKKDHQCPESGDTRWCETKQAERKECWTNWCLSMHSNYTWWQVCLTVNLFMHCIKRCVCIICLTINYNAAYMPSSFWTVISLATVNRCICDVPS